MKRKTHWVITLCFRLHPGLPQPWLQKENFFSLSHHVSWSSKIFPSGMNGQKVTKQREIPEWTSSEHHGAAAEDYWNTHCSWVYRFILKSEKDLKQTQFKETQQTRDDVRWKRQIDHLSVFIISSVNKLLIVFVTPENQNAHFNVTVECSAWAGSSVKPCGKMGLFSFCWSENPNTQSTCS